MIIFLKLLLFLLVVGMICVFVHFGKAFIRLVESCGPTIKPEKYRLPDDRHQGTVVCPNWKDGCTGWKDPPCPLCGGRGEIDHD